MARRTMSSLSSWHGLRNVKTKHKVFAGVIHADMGIKLHYSENAHLGQPAVGGVQAENVPSEHYSPRYCAYSNVIHVNQHRKMNAQTAPSFN